MAGVHKCALPAIKIFASSTRVSSEFRPLIRLASITMKASSPEYHPSVLNLTRKELQLLTALVLNQRTMS
jgi:hypothetical protein